MSENQVSQKVSIRKLVNGVSTVCVFSIRYVNEHFRMSFSKARIQRFNECENDVPPPGAYDPKLDLKVKGFVIEKSERFHDGKSMIGAECSLSASTKSTSNLVGSFRTAQHPRKKLPSKACSKVKPRSLIPNSDKKFKYKSEHQLADLQVECSNKSKTIQEHEKHIENVKEEIRKLKLQLEESCEKQMDVEEQHKRDIETMAKLQQDILNGHNERHQSEVENLRCQLLEVSEEKQREIEAGKAIEGDLRSHITDFTKKITALESELADERHASKEKIQSLEAQIEELKMKLEKLIESHKYEVNALEQEKYELDSSVKDLTDKLAECEEKLKRVIAESNEQINVMIMEAKTAAEEEMRLATERYKSCLARAEMERVALDEKLVQKDAEITRLSVTLEELKSSAETQESFGQSLQMELDRAETELAEKKEELRALKDQIRSEAAEMVARRKRFEVITAENQSSVAALTNRLAQSNAEVERLQHELKRGEDCINEHRDLLNIMRNNSEMVHEQVNALMEKLAAKKELVNQLEIDSLSEVESMKLAFEAKIEDLKEIATKEVTKLQADCDAKDAQSVEMKHQLHKMANCLSGAQAMLLQLEERNDAQELEISRVELLNSKLNEQFKETNVALEEANKLLEGQSEYKLSLHEAQSKIQELSDKIKYLQEKESDVEDKTELLKEEKSRREAVEAEVRKLAGYNERLRKDYQEMSEKYAELVGHQNHRQRIKHVSQLKDKINQLEQEMRVKIRTIEQQQKVIEKFKAEEKRSFKGKENTLGVSKIVLSSPVPSPQKPLTPLRNRNE